MLFKIIKENASRNRKSNKLFFISLVIQIVAFYLILSLENQSVVKLLNQIETYAVSKFFSLLPSIYFTSLIMFFFLVYFVKKYQLSNRSRELGMYLTFGMSKKKMLLMLALEELVEGVVSLLVALPIAIFVCEISNLIIRKVLGVSFSNYQLSIAIKPVLLTIIGYILVRLIVIAILGLKTWKKEIGNMISNVKENKSKKYNKLGETIKLFLSISIYICLYVYTSGLSFLELRLYDVQLIFLSLVLATALFMNGVSVIYHFIARSRKHSGLTLYSARQLQESVIEKSTSLAVCTILMFTAFSLITFGIVYNMMISEDVTDNIHYTFYNSHDEVEAAFKGIGMEEYVENIYTINSGVVCFEDQLDGTLDLAVDESILFNEYITIEEAGQLIGSDCLYVISQSGYNEVFKNSGIQPIALPINEVAYYVHKDNIGIEQSEKIELIVESEVELIIEGSAYRVYPLISNEPLYVNDIFELNFGYIVNDLLFESFIEYEIEYNNVMLTDEYLDEYGDIYGYININEKLIEEYGEDLEFASSLESRGRNIFYTLVIVFTSMYLGITFLIIGNTLIGIQYLIYQSKSKKRIKTIQYMGASSTQIKKSARKEISWYFGFPLVIASICAFISLKFLFILSDMKSYGVTVASVMITAIPIILTIIVVELVYINQVKKVSDRFITKVLEE